MKRILVMRLSAMGDVAMTVPVVASLLQQHPDVEITMLSTPRFEPMFAGIERLNFVGVDTKQTYKGVFGIVKLFRFLRKNYKFDQMVDLHDVLRSKVLRKLYWLTGTPVSIIDKGRAEKKDLVREGNTNKKQLKSSVSRYCEAFAQAGYRVDVNFSGLFPKDEAFELPFEKKGAWIGVAPFAQHQGKIYPIEKMEQVVRQLAQLPDVQVLLFGGGPKEKAVLEVWEKNIPSTVSLAGKYPLTTELHLLNACKAVVSMDSANMHLASLVGTPVVCVWGATHPYAGFNGYGQSLDNAVQVDMDCRPCSIYGNKPCKKGNFPCMNNISPDMVVEKVKKLL